MQGSEKSFFKYKQAEIPKRNPEYVVQNIWKVKVLRLKLRITPTVMIMLSKGQVVSEF